MTQDIQFRAIGYSIKYYIIVAIIDLIEFMFRLNKKGMIDTTIWFRWEGYTRAMVSIPKFRKTWDETKDVHAHEFRDFIDSL